MRALVMTATSHSYDRHCRCSRCDHSANFLADAFRRRTIIEEQGDAQAIFGWLWEAGSGPWFDPAALHDSDRPVFLVVDGHPTHRSRAVKDFVAATCGRLRLFLLPGYSPELNPDEWVWKNVKADRVGRAGVSGADALKAKAVSALHRLQKLPHLIRGFFADSNLRYITG